MRRSSRSGSAWSFSFRSARACSIARYQNAIIHRDLKPANILVAEVDGKPVPRIIDFGVAKATAPYLSGAYSAYPTRTPHGHGGLHESGASRPPSAHHRYAH